MRLSKKDAGILLDIIRQSEYNYKEKAVKYMQNEEYINTIYQPKLAEFEYLRNKIEASQATHS